jgi:hypothetical protein
MGGHPACGASGRLAPIVWSLTDGATGLPLDGRPAFNASRNGIEYSVSPDNSLLAVSLAVELVVIDLRTWSEVAVVDFPGIPLDPQFWSPDGSKLYLRLGFGTRLRTGPALFSDRRIWELDIATMALTQLPDLPFDSMLSPAVSNDGRLLYALAFDRDDVGYYWVAGGDPFLSVIELSSGREVRRVPLPGLKLGTDAEEVTYTPAAVLDEARGRYCIAHADSEAVTVVDLVTGSASVVTASGEPSEGLPSRLLDGLASLFVSSAEAKGAGFHDRQAALSRDGSLLLVAGTDDTTSGYLPAGLRVIDPHAGNLVHFEPGIDEFVVSRDGRYVFGIGCAHQFVEGWAPSDCAGLRVLDLETMELTAHVEPGRPYTGMALTLDGRYLHLTSEGAGRIEMREHGLDACDTPCIEVVLDVVEVGTWKVVARRESEASFAPVGP